MAASLFKVGDVVTPGGSVFSYLRYRPERDKNQKTKYAVGIIGPGEKLKLVYGPVAVGQDIWWVAMTDEAKSVRSVDGSHPLLGKQVAAWVNELYGGARNLVKA